MKKAEFDKFAEEYTKLHKRNINISGEDPSYFAEYKVLRTKTLLEKYNLPQNLHILDFGSGIGNSIPFFKKHLPNANLTCLDVSQKSIDIAKNRNSNHTDFKIFNGRTIPLANQTYDLIFAACVFHHIAHEEHLQLFHEMLRILKPGGAVIIFEHNPLNPLTIHAVNTCPFDENAILIKAKKLKKVISSAGFHNPKINYTLFFPSILKLLRPLERYLTKLPVGAQYYVSAVKKK